MPSLGMMTVNALAAADSVIIPSQPNFLSTKGLNLLLRSIARIKRQINPRLRIDGILLTMVDNRTNNAKSIITSLRSSVGENIRVFESEIPFSVRAAECSLSGESIFSHDKNGKVAAAYEALTKEVTEIEERAKNRPGPDWIVFETLYRDDVEITTHKDIEDKDQTVTITPPPDIPKTGDTTNIPLWGALMSLFAQSFRSNATAFFPVPEKSS